MAQINQLSDNKSYYLDRNGQIKEVSFLDRIKNLFHVGGVRTGINNLMAAVKRSMVNELATVNKNLNKDLQDRLSPQRSSFLSGTDLKEIAANFKQVHKRDLAQVSISKAKEAANEVVAFIFDAYKEGYYTHDSNGNLLKLNLNINEQKNVEDFLLRSVTQLWKDPPLQADGINVKTDAIKEQAKDMFDQVLKNLCLLKNSESLGKPMLTEQYLDYLFTKMFDIKQGYVRETDKIFKTQTLTFKLENENDVKQLNLLNDKNDSAKISFYLETINQVDDNNKDEKSTYCRNRQTYDETFNYLFNKSDDAEGKLKDMLLKHRGVILKNAVGQARSLEQVREKVDGFKQNYDEINKVAANYEYFKTSAYELIDLLGGKTLPSGAFMHMHTAMTKLKGHFAKLANASTPAEIYKELNSYRNTAYKELSKNQDLYKLMNESQDAKQSIDDFMLRIVINSLPQDQLEQLKEKVKGKTFINTMAIADSLIANDPEAPEFKGNSNLWGSYNSANNGVHSVCVIIQQTLLPKAEADEIFNDLSQRQAENIQPTDTESVNEIKSLIMSQAKDMAAKLK
ncbi:MAG: hypothetical protein K6F05_07400 [Succinivibrio sp.]|nr:hypothetical protein [Succinivibrio sp.]